MAKIVGLIGSVKGKLGNSVMAVRRGVQIARVYQPTVANPKSRRQQYSRAKFAVAVMVAKPIAQIFNMGWGRVAPTYTFQKAIGEIVPVGNHVITDAGSDRLAVSTAELLARVSAPGLPSPIFGDADVSVSEKVIVPVTLAASCFTNPNGGAERCGVVMFLYAKSDIDNNIPGALVAIKQAEIEHPDVEQNVEIDYPVLYSGMKVHVAGFAKQIPESNNGIDSDVTPWMFPAATSAASVYGEVTLA